MKFAADLVEHDAGNTGAVVVCDNELAREHTIGSGDLRRFGTGAIHFNEWNENGGVGAHLIEFFLGGVERIFVLREVFVPDQR